MTPSTAIHDRFTSTTQWDIFRYESDTHTTQAKPFFTEEAEYLVMAARALAAGNHSVWERYWNMALRMRECGQRFAYHHSQFLGNLTLNGGINLFSTLLCGGAGTPFDNANAYLGVGDSNTIEDATQVGLQAASNKLYFPMDVSFPTFGANQQASWKATFGPSQANYHWLEFTVANGNSDSAINLNRKVNDQGVKEAGKTWVPTLTIIWS